jgi:hypothetical protein
MLTYSLAVQRFLPSRIWLATLAHRSYSSSLATAGLDCGAGLRFGPDTAQDSLTSGNRWEATARSIPALVQATARCAHKSGAPRSGSVTAKGVAPLLFSQCSLSSRAVHPIDRRLHRLQLQCRPGRDGVRRRTHHRRLPHLQGNTIHERAGSIRRPRPPLPEYSDNSGIWSRWTARRPTASCGGPSSGNSLRRNCSPIRMPATTSGSADSLGTPTKTRPWYRSVCIACAPAGASVR